MNYQVNKLKREIRSIMNEVYSVNESITMLERQELIRGFEDGINEEIGGFLGRMAGKTANFFSKAADKATEWKDKSSKAISTMGTNIKNTYNAAVKKAEEFYQKGKQLAGEAWEKIKNFADQCVQKIQSGYAAAMNAIASGWKSFKNALSTTYNEVSQAISSAWEQMKEEAAAFGEAIAAIWANIVKETAAMIQSMKQKMKEMGEKSSKWIQENKAELEKDAQIAAQSTLEGLKTLGQKTMEILKQGKDIAVEVGMVIVFMVVYPFELLWKGIKAIPGVAERVSVMVKDFINKEVEEYKSEYARVRGEGKSEGGETTESGAKPDVQTRYKELLAAWKDEQKKLGKNANPGQGTRTRLMKQAESEVGSTSERLKYLKTFENFKY